MTVNGDPDVVDGIEYWTTQPASNDGVLGGYGSGVKEFLSSFVSLFSSNL